MQLFKLKTRLSEFDSFADFAKEFNLTKEDLIITNEFLYNPYMRGLNLPCRFIMQEQYGMGEPSDEMINHILADIQLENYTRVIAVGGGTVIDISKLFTLRGIVNATDAFERKIPIEKARQLVVLPTTCGTGSEVTNISIAEIKSRHTKMGLADDALLADDAVLIPELVRGLPYKFFVCSSIDALIHAVESYVSPKSNPYTQIFCRAAIESIIDVFKHIAAQGPEYRLERLKEMLIASNSETPEWVPYTHYLTRSGETITYPTGKLITSSSRKYSNSITRKNLSGTSRKLTHYSHTSWKPTRNTCMKNSITYWVNCYPKNHSTPMV